MYRLHQNLIGLRRRHPWLVRARTEVLHLDNQAFAYRAVDPESGARLAVLLNISDSPVDFPSVDASAERLLAGAPYDDAADSKPDAPGRPARLGRTRAPVVRRPPRSLKGNKVITAGNGKGAGEV